MKIGRNDPCPCGSGFKYKRCHGRYGRYAIEMPAKMTMPPNRQQTGVRPATFNQEVPRNLLGVPGAYYQLWLRNMRKGEQRDSPFENRPGKYKVTFTLGRHALDRQDLNFQGGDGDSFVQIAKPENERTDQDAERVVIFSAHATPRGVEKIEVEGIPNKAGRLAQCAVELEAASFSEADRIAFGAVSNFFSALAFELDVPVRLGQLNIEQTSSQNGSMTYTCPYPDVHLTAAGTDLNSTPYIQSLRSLYREGINSNSMNYQFLCWYKIVEGVNWKRKQELSAQSSNAKMEFKLQTPEILPSTKEEMRKALAGLLPLLGSAGTQDERWDHAVPSEVLGWRFNRIRQEKLEPVRNKIAHMLSEPSGDLSLSPDTHSHRAEVTTWVTLLRLIARVMVRNERARLPQPPPIFASQPVSGRHISEAREQFRKS